ncbi:MAG: LamG domain-containing protein [Nannocystaceae bacterium]
MLRAKIPPGAHAKLAAATALIAGCCRMPNPAFGLAYGDTGAAGAQPHSTAGAPNGLTSEIVPSPGGGGSGGDTESAGASETTDGSPQNTDDAPGDAPRDGDAPGDGDDPCLVRAEHLVLCLDFEELEAGKIVDRSGHNNHAQLTGDASQAVGVHGKALVCDATLRASIPDSDSLDLIDFTIDLWIRPDGSAQDWEGVLDNDGQYGLWLGAGGIECRRGSDYLSAVSILPEVWTHVRCVSMGDQLTIYLDGLNWASIVPVSADHPVDNDRPLALGNASPEWQRPFSGQIDTLRI